jgi:hypothetical protein
MARRTRWRNRKITGNLARVNRRDDEPDLEALEPSGFDGLFEQPTADDRLDASPARPGRRRSQAFVAIAVLLAAGVGSAITLAMTDGNRSTSPPPSPTSTSVISQNVVTRIDQPTHIGGWTIIATDFQRASTLPVKARVGQPSINAPLSHVWLIADLVVVNDTSEIRSTSVVLQTRCRWSRRPGRTEIEGT